VAFDLFTDIDSATLRRKIFIKLADVYTLTDSLGMNLIITYHGGQLYKKNDILKEADRIVNMWSQLVHFFKGFGYNNLFFGLYNEPRISGADWTRAYFRMMSKLRLLDKERYWIIGSTNYNGIDAFINLKR